MLNIAIFKAVFNKRDQQHGFNGQAAVYAFNIDMQVGDAFNFNPLKIDKIQKTNLYS